MVLQSDDYQPKSTITRTQGGYKVNRTFFFLAESDLEAVDCPDIPKYNATLTVPPGSGGIVVYLTSIAVSHTGDGDPATGLLWFQCDLGYEESVGDNPILNQASWSTTLRPRQITVASSVNQAHYPPAPTDDPRGYTGSGINVGDNGAEGVSIDESVLTLTVKHWISPGDTLSYLADLYDMRDTVNDAAFSGPWGSWDAGTTRYMGFELSHIDGGIDQVSHEFLYVPNASVMMAAKLLTGGLINVFKKGHEYVWSTVTEWTDPDDDTKHYRESLSAHHVKDLYAEADFSIFVFPF